MASKLCSIEMHWCNVNQIIYKTLLSGSMEILLLVII